MNEQLGTMINTQPSPQQLPDPNVASLVPQAGAPNPADQAKATLGNATFLQSLLLPKKDEQSEGKQPVDGSTEPHNATQDTETPQEDKVESGMEERLMKQIDTLKEQIQNNHQQDEISKIKEELTRLLSEDDGGQE